MELANNNTVIPDLPGVQPGVSPGSFSVPLPIDVYHSIETYISHSGMCELLRSPAHYATYLKKDAGEDKVNFGSAVHCAVLEPEEFKKQYVVFDGRRSGKAYDEFKAANPGATILSMDEHRRIQGILNAMHQFSEFPLMDAIRIGESEKSIFWINKETGAPCRIRTDSLNPYSTFDVKTIDDARPEKVQAQIMRMDYDLQAYMYTDGVASYTGDYRPFNFAFVEDKEPHGIWLYTAGASLLASGREKFLRGAKAFMEFHKANLAQCYTKAFSVIEAPQWRRRELAQLAGGETVVPAGQEDACYL